LEQTPWLSQFALTRRATCGIEETEVIALHHAAGKHYFGIDVFV
jgi:hypothetical protein